VKISQKLILTFSGFVALVVCAGAISLFQLHRIARSLIKDIPENIEQINRMSQLDGLAQSIRYYDEVLTQSARNYAFTQDEEWKKRYEDIEPKLDRIIKQAISRGDKEDKSFFSSVDQANIALVELEYRSIELVKNGQVREAVEILESDEYWRHKETYNEGLMNYVHRRDHKQDRAFETSSEIMHSLSKRSQKLIDRSRLSVLISVAAALILSVLMSLYAFRKTKHLMRLRESAAEIGKGNLDTQVAVESNDEIGFVAQMLNSMASNLREVTSSRDVLNQEISTREQAEKTLKETHAELERRIAEQGQAQDAALNMMEDIELENAGRKKVEHSLREMALFAELNPAPVLRFNPEGVILLCNEATVQILGPAAKKGAPLKNVLPVLTSAELKHCIRQGTVFTKEVHIRDRFYQFVVLGVPDHRLGQIYGSDITDRKKAEDELKEAQAELIESAHAAGRAEVAANVLHNVGNILNSINVSANVVTEKVVHSEIGNLGRVAGIVNDNVEDLGTFLTQHPQGKHIPEYLSEVARCLQNEQTEIVDRLQMLNDNVRHIKDIISVQQAYARIAGVEVRASLVKLVEDAIQINSTGLERHGIQLVREFEELVDVEIDKQRVIQILVNLINNAKDSLGLSAKDDKSMTVRIYRPNEDRCCIEVADNGIGISEENLTKIFTHGFTTKTHGHGFGLHSCALASREMQGSLTAHSDGVGQGATFTLELPFKPSEDVE
jgi:signal transduction histidine kinase/HAMP domain-containing protein